MDEHIVVKEGELYAVFNETQMTGEEVDVTYTVTSADRHI